MVTHCPDTSNFSVPSSDASVQRTLYTRSLFLAFSCYILWGFFPLFFRLLHPAQPLEVIVHRAVWGLFFCLVALTLMRHLHHLREALRDRGTVLRLAAAGFLIVINWTVYVYAVMSGHTIDAALGYFINPLMTVALGLCVLHERITRLQMISLSLGIIAVVILIVGLGHLPWIALALPLSFSLYSLVKKDVAHKVGPVEGMAIETAIVSPFLLIYLAYLAWNHSTSFHVITAGNSDVAWGLHLALLISAGAITMIPLIMYATASQGLPLGTIGFIQYVSPVMQLVLGVFLFHEEMEPMRWVATGFIWLALIFLTLDLAIATRRARKLICKQPTATP
ncbi:EamA family transporter RarD [Schaalia sp. lx-100]|uniref:EamA family transporter RarD n=1 Tax=Schaalia sp. lx-100 TaxID=2899081 RepID=UPI003FA75879